MRKFMKSAVLILAAVTLFAGCSKKSDSNKSMADVVVEKDGKISVKYEEIFDKDYYTEEDLEKVIDEDVALFNKENGADSVTKESLKVKKDVALLWYKFANSDSYVKYTNDFVKPEKEMKLFVGSIKDAEEKNIKLGGKFDKVGETGTVTKDQLENKDELTVFYTNSEMTVYVPGEIVYFNDNVTIDKDVVTTTADKVNYILYKAED